jgi:hypothetical protein
MPDELVSPTDQQLVEHLQAYAGAALRGVVRYTEEDR